MEMTIGGAAGAIAARRSRPFRFIGFCAAAFIAAGLALRPAAAVAHGDYTKAQAQAGRQLFARHCSQCHGAQLQGQAGPPLKGPAFAANLRFSKMSAQQLYDFMKSQMPANNPGSLSERQYLEALAFILSQNGYPSGPHPLSPKTVGRVKLLPYPGGANHAASSGAQANSNR